MMTATDETNQDAVWRALADPSRRRILELLRDAPMRTGDLAERFASSRYAVMKHLSALHDAGLVLVTRRGRERWNHLNPTPLLERVDQFVTPFQAAAAARLIRLKRHVESSRPIPQEAPMTESNAASVATFELEITIDAPPDQVWRAFTDDIDHWWRPDFRTDARSQRMMLETKVGGRLFEDYGDDDGLLWATVVSLKRGERIDLVGHSFPEWGGPHVGYHTFTFRADGAATALRLSDAYHGHVDPNTIASLETGWKTLLGDGLKPYVERLAPPPPGD